MKAIIDKLAFAGNPISEKDLLQQILNDLGVGYQDIATFITASKLYYGDAYRLFLTHETKLEQSQNEKNMFNAYYAATCATIPIYNNYGMMIAYYAQIRGNTRKESYVEGFQNNYSGHLGVKITHLVAEGYPSILIQKDFLLEFVTLVIMVEVK